jgi:hypothetical protein
VLADVDGTLVTHEKVLTLRSEGILAPSNVELITALISCNWQIPLSTFGCEPQRGGFAADYLGSKTRLDEKAASSARRRGMINSKPYENND